METLEVKRLSLASVFKLILAGMFCSLVPLYIVLGFLALFGLPTISLGDQAVTGFPAIIIAPLQGTVFALALSVIVSPLTAIGSWLLAKYTDISISIDIEK